MSSAPPGDVLRSASFAAEDAVQPGVLIAASYRRIRPASPAVEYHRLHAWVISCPQTPGLRLRTPSADSPWVDCPVGMLFVFAPDTPFWEDYQALRNQRFSSTYLVFTDPGHQLAHLTGRSNGFARIHDAHGRLGEAIREPYADGRAGPPDRWRCQASLAHLISLLRPIQARTDGVWKAGRAARTSDLPVQVDAWFEARLAQRLSISALARQLGLPASTLAHRYRAATGTTPMRRLAEMRVQKLQVLLAHGALLREAAEACGFVDSFHASRRFRAITGLTPTAWLATIRDCPST